METESAIPSESRWEQLVAAHERAEHPPLAEAPVHEPIAAILACSDARVPPSVVFDQPAGQLFVVRIAGNTASPAALASLEFAVAVLGVDLIIVLGHTGCGAAQAAAAGSYDGHLAPIVEPICRIARTMPGASVDDIVRHNVMHTVDDLVQSDGAIGEAAKNGTLNIHGAVHDIVSSHLHVLS